MFLYLTLFFGITDTTKPTCYIILSPALCCSVLLYCGRTPLNQDLVLKHVHGNTAKYFTSWEENKRYGLKIVRTEPLVK